MIMRKESTLLPLDPRAQEFLAELSAQATPPLQDLTPEQARQGMLATTALLGEPPSVAQVEDLEIPGPNGQVPVRLYRPAITGPLPLLVYFHGGGWVMGNIDTHDGLCRSLANSAQCLVASVDYRLAPEHKYPAAVEDAYAATSWLAEHSGRWQTNATIVAGDSAGGNLAAAVALMARDRAAPPLKLQVLVYPITDFSFETASYAQFADGYLLTKEAMKWFWEHYLATPTQGTEPYASVLQAASLRGLPPALVIAAGYDPLRDEGKAYADRLAQAGVLVTYKCYESMLHGFLRRSDRFQQATDTIGDIAEAIRRM